jgi:glycosyltransferase involved in cell wall biosynthesis
MANCYAGSLQRHLPSAAVLSSMRTGKRLPWLFRRSLRQTCQVVANSRAAALTLVAQHNVRSDRISVIHNSLVFPPLAAASPILRETTRSAQGAGPRTMVLLCVAMFRPEKNQRALIEIVSGLPAGTDWQLWLAGDGATRGSCEALVAQKQLEARIKFPGWQQDPSALYAAADVAVHASQSESLSNFLIEAQARGLPAVTYAAQGNEECFIPGDTGFVITPGDDSSFRSTLLALADTPASERAARSQRARDYARTAFDPQRQVAAYLELFHKLAPAPRTS